MNTPFFDLISSGGAPNVACNLLTPNNGINKFSIKACWAQTGNLSFGKLGNFVQRDLGNLITGPFLDLVNRNGVQLNFGPTTNNSRVQDVIPRGCVPFFDLISSG